MRLPTFSACPQSSTPTRLYASTVLSRPQMYESFHCTAAPTSCSSRPIDSSTRSYRSATGQSGLGSLPARFQMTLSVLTRSAPLLQFAACLRTWPVSPACSIWISRIALIRFIV